MSAVGGYGVCTMLHEYTSDNMQNSNFVFFYSSPQMADCGGMPQVDQVCMREKENRVGNAWEMTRETLMLYSRLDRAG